MKAQENSEQVRQQMIRFIKAHYSRTLGKDIKLLDQPGGLAILHERCKAGKYDHYRQQHNLSWWQRILSWIRSTWS